MKKKIGLALGSGSARGLAHLGVIEVLEEHGIEAEIVAGTSVGSAVGAFYAEGKLDQLKEFMLTVDLWKILSFFEVNIPRSGLLDGRKFTRFLSENIDAPDIEDLGKSFAAVCCDLLTGERVMLDHGDTIMAVRASSSIPGLFSPMEHEGRFLVDGGLVDPVPVTAARDLGADVVIAVDLNYHIPGRNVKPRRETKHVGRRKMHPLQALLEKVGRERKEKSVKPGIINILMDSTLVIERNLTEMNLQNSAPDIVVRPDLGDIRFLEFNRAEEGITAGRKAAESMMGDILKTLDR